MQYPEVLQRIINSRCKWQMDKFGMMTGYRDDLPGQVFCPLTAACFEFTGIYYRPSEAAEAARQIGMPPGFAVAFTDANDNFGMRAAFFKGWVAAMTSPIEIGRARQRLKIRADILRFTNLEKAEAERMANHHTSQPEVGIAPA